MTTQLHIGPSTKAAIRKQLAIGVTVEKVADLFGLPVKVVRKIERERMRP